MQYGCHRIRKGVSVLRKRRALLIGPHVTFSLRITDDSTYALGLASFSLFVLA